MGRNTMNMHCDIVSITVGHRAITVRQWVYIFVTFKITQDSSLFVMTRI